jgi:hypothetical protein
MKLDFQLIYLTGQISETVKWVQTSYNGWPTDAMNLPYV